MDTARVFVWRVRLCLLALAWGLVGVGADKPGSVPQPVQRSQSRPVVQTLAALSTSAVAAHVGSGPASRSLSEPLKRARVKMAVPRPLDLRCPGKATKSPDSLQLARKSTRAQKSSGCKLTGGGGTSIKSAVPGQRKPTASVSKKRDASTGPTRNAESPRSRHKVAGKSDARPGDNVAALRPARPTRRGNAVASSRHQEGPAPS